MPNGYALGQLSSAFLTATTHEDLAVRKRADRRAERWMQALEAMSSGDVSVGSRTPVVGLPAWVTLEVLRGGFTTGKAVAEGSLEPDEVALAKRVGLHGVRRLIFGYYITDAGLRELYELLDRGAYRVDVPEDAALLTVAWLVRAGDRAGALELLEVFSPFADRMRFAPRETLAPSTPADHVYRSTVADARTVLKTRREQERVEAQREALAVWNPFADRLLALWWPHFHDGQLDLSVTEDWLTEARRLTDEYQRLARVHTRSTKHRKPKENFAILIAATLEVLRKGRLQRRQIGLVTASVNAMVAKRGAPGSDQLAALRQAQSTVAQAPAHRALAAVAAERLSQLDQDEGIAEPASYGYPVSAKEAELTSVPAGMTMPLIVPRVLARTHAAPIETLLEEGVVPSAEVLAELVPRISATVVASTYRDAALARLMAANYRAFRRRRSLLLLNLEKQIQITELPWVRATLPHSVTAEDEAVAVTRRVGSLALDNFPGTIMPNPLVQELHHLLRVAGHDVPLVEELAADIFMGHFSDKFRRAAQVAARNANGRLYAEYYGIDYDQILELDEPPQPARWRWRRVAPQPPAVTFSSICQSRAANGQTSRRSVAANGTVIEQSQILTTHNLAALVSLNVLPRQSWAELADLAYARAVSLLGLAQQQKQPLATIKDAAYAWRQTIFFLSLAPRTELDAFLERALSDEARSVHGVSELLAGLVHVAEGRQFDSDGACPGGRRFLGWTTKRHWVLSDRPAAES
jgi:hypothetical protein